ncbi:MAG: DUF58 domain-containing protein [Bacteroidales bacterium]|nr:DUF58 domain-containing protein [Bacteroidales bacterium]
MNYSIDHHRIEQFGTLEFLARQVVEGFIVGLHKSPFHGFSVEFAEHWLYNSGESTKHIDWKLFARTDKLFVKKYEEETNLRCQIIIDKSSSMYFPVRERISINEPNKVTFAVYAAASLIYLLKKQRDAFGISLFSDHIEWHTETKSSSVHQRFVYSLLEKLLPPEQDRPRKTSAAEALHEIADKIHKRSLVVIFSDMLDTGSGQDQLFSALQHLRHNKHEVLLFHVTDRAREMEFDYDNRPYRFVDLESGEQVRLYPASIRDEYRKSVHRFRETLKIRCAQYNIDFIDADINQGLEHILLTYLVKRSRLY